MRTLSIGKMPDLGIILSDHSKNQKRKKKKEKKEEGKEGKRKKEKKRTICICVDRLCDTLQKTHSDERCNMRKDSRQDRGGWGEGTRARSATTMQTSSQRTEKNLKFVDLIDEKIVQDKACKSGLNLLMVEMRGGKQMLPR
mmetsp:Transcript_39589/g.77956  ORF Transcript_39589/g.77956 Transcript_39589/m.77956 type:complete len:141 (-) Transcript_39589:1142-1564(-)